MKHAGANSCTASTARLRGNRRPPLQGKRISREEFTLLDRTILEAGGNVMREVTRDRERWRMAFGKAMAPPAKPPGAGRGERNRKPPLHSYHPFLFHSAFPEIPRQTVQELAVADRLYTEHLLDCDRTLDRPPHPYPGFLFLSQLELVRSLKRLYRLFPPGSPFWTYFFRCHRKTWRAVREEWLWQRHRVTPMSLARFLALARGKTSLFKPCTVALAFLSRGGREPSWISRALDHHHTGLVLLDDLEDWKEDFLRGNYTFLLTRVLSHAGLQKRITKGENVPLREIGMHLYGSGEAERQLRWAENRFQKAIRIPEKVQIPLWKALNQRYARRCRRVCRQVEEYREKEIERQGPAWSGTARRTATERGSTRVFTHPGVPRQLSVYASGITRRCGERLPAAMPRALYLGHWVSMPAYFLSQDDHGACCAVNLPFPVTFPLTSTDRVPLRLEIVTAFLASGRYRDHGPVANLLEELLLRGMGLWVSRQLWPEKTCSRLLGMCLLEWQWSMKHERYLWEQLEPRVHDPLRPITSLPGIHRPPSLHDLGSFPGRFLLFLGFRFLSHIQARSLSTDPVHTFGMRPAALRGELERYLYH